MLERGGSVLLISGFDEVRGGGLFVFDGTRLETIDRLNTTGLALADGTVGRSLCASIDNPPAARLVLYDDRGVAEYRRFDSIVDPHDLAMLDDGTWVMVSSLRNEIVRVLPDGSLETLWRPSEVPDSWHPNCVAVVDGEIWVTAFGRFDTSRGWSEEGGRGTGFLRNLSTGEELGDLSYPHSPVRDGSRWWVCNSLTQSLVCRDDGGDGWEHRVLLQGYLRGLAVDGDTFYVGESARRHRPDEEYAGLAVVRHDEVVERVTFPCAEIYEVIVAPSAVLEGLRRGFELRPPAPSGDPSSTLLTAVGDATLVETIGRKLEPQLVATRIALDPFTTMASAEVRHVRTVVKNLGSVPLASVQPHPVNLGYRWIDDRGEAIDGERIVLGKALYPGHSAPYGIDLTAPDVPGTYLLSISLVQEGNFWLDDVDNDNGVRLTVEVTNGRQADGERNGA